MSIIKSSIKFPVTVIVGTLIAVLGGLLALFRVPIQLTPEVEKPFISVNTSWHGASPEEIEKDIVDEQEKFLKRIEGLEKMTSESSDGRGSITLEFPLGTDIIGATVKVNNKLGEVPSYPENADQPVVSSSSPFEGAIAWFVIKSTDSSVYVPELLTLIEDLVQPRLERVQGVAAINIFGGLQQELHVEFDPQEMASLGITVPQLVASLRSENRDISGGDFSEGKRRYVVRTLSRFESIESVEETVVALRGTTPIRIGDIAEVKLGFQKPRAFVRHKGQPAIAFNAQRQIGANVLEVMDGLLVAMEKINEDILRPRNLEMLNVYRETKYIHSAINLVFINMLFGSLLAIGILFFFLRSPASIIVIGISIPVSVISAFLTMFLFGRSINVISLAGMAFAAGMVVDSAIVVMENIYRHLQMGKSRWKASADGTTEVWGAILASAVTTIAVFLPVLFIQERAAQLFRDIAIAISTAIAISLLVSVTIIPSLSARILKLSSGFDSAGGSFVGRLADRSASIVSFLNEKLWRRLTVVGGGIALTVGLSWGLLPHSEYLPNGNQNLIFAIMLPPPGYNLDEMLEMGKSIEEQISYLWTTPEEEQEEIPGGGIDNFFFVAFAGQAFMGLVANDPSRVKELEQVANEAIYSIPGVFGFARQSSLFSRGLAGTRSVKLDITGPQMDKILSLGREVFQRVGQTLPGSNSRPIPGLDLGNPEVRIRPDKVRAADVGLSASDIGVTISALVDGTVVSGFRHEGRELDLVLKGAGNLAAHTQDIRYLPLATPSGKIITLSDVAEVTLAQGPIQINHVERQRAISIETVLPDDVALEEAIEKVKAEIINPMREEGKLGNLYDISISGTADELAKLRKSLTWNFIIALALTFLLLAALFQSFIYPLVIMLTVPLATFGGVLGLRLVQLFNTEQRLDVLTMLGFVILIGTVVNNSILIVHQALRFMNDGSSSHEAVKESVRIRVRPILMSTMTSAFGMAPLIIMPGAGSELYRGLGSVVVGGLVFSSLVTLVITPLVFSFAIDGVRKIRGWLGLPEFASSTANEADLA